MRVEGGSQVHRRYGSPVPGFFRSSCQVSILLIDQMGLFATTSLREEG